MPTYSYACTACEHHFDVQQSFTDDALTVCPDCGERLRKLFGNVGVVFKGSGFYRTDSRKDGSRTSRGGSSSSSTTSSDGGSSSSGSGASSSSGGTSAASSGSAAATTPTSSGSSSGGSSGTPSSSPSKAASGA